jgi:hypothetical protein
MILIWLPREHSRPDQQSNRGLNERSLRTEQQNGGLKIQDKATQFYDNKTP